MAEAEGTCCAIPSCSTHWSVLLRRVFAPIQFLEAERGIRRVWRWAKSRGCPPSHVPFCLFTPSQQLRNTTSILLPQSDRRPPILRVSGQRTAFSYTLPSASWPRSEPSPGACSLAPGMSQTIKPIATRHQRGPPVNSDLPWRCPHRRRLLGLRYPPRTLVLCALSVARFEFLPTVSSTASLHLVYQNAQLGLLPGLARLHGSPVQDFCGRPQTEAATSSLITSGLFYSGVFAIPTQCPRNSTTSPKH